MNNIRRAIVRMGMTTILFAVMMMTLFVTPVFAQDTKEYCPDRSYLLYTGERNPPEYRNGYDDIVKNYLTSSQDGTVYPLVTNQTDKSGNEPTQWSRWGIVDIGDGWSMIRSCLTGRYLTIRGYDVVAIFPHEANDEQRLWQVKRSANARNEYEPLYTIYNKTHGGVHLEGAQHRILINGARNGEPSDRYNPRLNWNVY